MISKYPPRCWCGCAAVTHMHYRPGRDCGNCGANLCYGYARRDLPLPAGHELAAARSDAHTMRNLAVLAPFGMTRQFHPEIRRLVPRPRITPLDERRRGRR